RRACARGTGQRVPAGPGAPAGACAVTSEITTRGAKGGRKVRERAWCDDRFDATRGGAMKSRNVETHRAGHEAFNRRDFGAMVEGYAETISWTDQARGMTFRTPEEFRSEFLEGWVQASSDCQVTDAEYVDAGDMVVARFTCRGTNDGPIGPFPATGKGWTLPI